MKQYFLVIIMFLTVWIMPVANARTIEVDVYGMTCAFCMNSLERKFGKIKSISKIEISLKQKRIRLQTKATLPTIETIKQTVLEAGFTPIKITIINNEK